MNVLVDSSVWSLALRRNTTNDAIAIVKVLQDLIADGRVVLLGAIRQEVLSGTEDYELAAEFFNTCRSNGVQGSNTDFLLCAVAHCRGYSILTTDKDFENFRSHIPVVLL
ncbi:MAG: PIN domain nuclease [Oscillatoriales cyanobacterium]|nr:MAG: PIN domain nuclease [Oscillatoriales cyanobacterium]